MKTNLTSSLDFGFGRPEDEIFRLRSGVKKSLPEGIFKNLICLEAKGCEIGPT